MAKALVIGVVSDTHGLLRPEALAHLRSVDHIVHAGDIGSPEVLAALEALAPVSAIRGNNDTAAWSRHLPEVKTIRLGAVRLHVLHDLHDLAIDPLAERIDAVIAGHSHKPMLSEENGVLYLNPGSIGPRRFKLPVAMGRMVVAQRKIKAEIIELTSDIAASPSHDRAKLTR